MPLCLAFISREIYVAFLSQHELSPVPKAFGVKAVVVEDDIFDYVVFAQQIVCDDAFALQMLFDEVCGEAGIYAFKAVKEKSSAKGEFIDDSIPPDEVMVAHHFDECKFVR